MDTNELRNRWIEYWNHQEETGYRHTGEPFPPELLGMICGAKTRAGTPCKQKNIYRNGRCKHHGGAATGPTTEAGKEQCRINGRKGGRPRKDGGVGAEALRQQAPRLLKDVRISEAAIESEVMAHNGNGNPKITLRFPGHEMSIDAHVLTIHEQPKITPEKPKSCMVKEAKVLEVSHRCADCRNLSANWVCQAAARGEIEGGGEFRPVLSEPRNCQAFKHWKT